MPYPVVFTQLERIASMETRLQSLEVKVDSMDNKLDQLLARKNKEQGAFWLISAIFGTGVVSVMLAVFHYITGR